MKNAEEYKRSGDECRSSGKIEDSVSLYRMALDLNPDFWEVHANLSMALVGQGDYEDALRHAKRAIDLSPHIAELHDNLGTIYRIQGDYSRSVDAHDNALKIAPNLVSALYNISLALEKNGDIERAIGSLKRSLFINNDQSDVHSRIGSLHFINKEYKESALHYERAWEIDPVSSEILHGLERSYLAMASDMVENSGFDEAFSVYNRVIEFSPQLIDPYIGLGYVSAMRNKYGDAVIYYKMAIEIDPYGNKYAYNGLGNALAKTGDLDGAEDAYRMATEINSDDQEAYNGLGNILSDKGEIKEAISCYKKSIEIDPEYAIAYRNLSKVLRFDGGEKILSDMTKIYDQDNISEYGRMHLAFAIGKAYEDIGEYNKSILFYLKGNRLKRKSYSYSVNDSVHLFNNIKEIFSRDIFPVNGRGGCLEQSPIFIVGMPRSGTSLVEQILASHSQVHGAGELTILQDLMKKYCSDMDRESLEGCFSNPFSESLKSMGEEYIQRARELSPDKKYIVDKMPHNFLRLGVIKLILPNARVVSCVRDPMDNCLSIFKNYFSANHNYAYDLNELGKYYNLYHSLMEYWRELFPGFIYDIKYEDLVNNQEEETKSLLKYCGLSWDDECLSFYKTKRNVGTASNAQVRRHIYKDSVQLWKRYEKELAPLSTAIYGNN